MIYFNLLTIQSFLWYWPERHPTLPCCHLAIEGGLLSTNACGHSPASATDICIKHAMQFWSSVSSLAKEGLCKALSKTFFEFGVPMTLSIPMTGSSLPSSLESWIAGDNICYTSNQKMFPHYSLCLGLLLGVTQNEMRYSSNIWILFMCSPVLCFLRLSKPRELSLVLCDMSCKSLPSAFGHIFVCQ